MASSSRSSTGTPVGAHTAPGDTRNGFHMLQALARQDGASAANVVQDLGPLSKAIKDSGNLLGTPNILSSSLRLPGRSKKRKRSDDEGKSGDESGLGDDDDEDDDDDDEDDHEDSSRPCRLPFNSVAVLGLAARNLEETASSIMSANVKTAFQAALPRTPYLY